MAVLILTVENGSFAYPKGSQIFKDINFSVNSGEILAVLGPNGAGKTTMLRCITGMLRLKGGKSLLDGEDIHSMPARKLWRRMAYVPQAKTASSAYTAFQTVLLGRSSRLSGLSTPKKTDLEAAERVMEQLGILNLAERPCSAMSGGELQMVLIARALAAEPEVLILDEPESNLDFKNQLVVLDTMTSLARQGMACIFNTHYPAHALQRADKSLILSKDGTCVFGSTGSVVTEENIRRAFGVNAVIGEIETPENILRNVVPLSIAEDGEITEKRTPENRRCIASVTIIADSNESADKINALLHEYNRLLIGRMGMPYRKCGLYIINTTMDGTETEIAEVSHKLNLLPGISVKTTFAKGNFDEREQDRGE